MALLKNGSSGDLVKKLQAKLGLVADGVFGAGTEKALKAWQQANGLKADGVAGDATLLKMGISVNTVPSGSFNLAALKGHIPDAVIAQIPDTAARFGITTPLRLAHFLAQCSHESGGFRVVTENLNYSAQGLANTFPNRFAVNPGARVKTPNALANRLNRNPEAIANNVYSNRMGNGNEASGEGWKYRGRGYIQLTGKNNYRAFDATVQDNILENPDLIATKYPLASAGFFFKSNNLWSICDKGSDDATVTAVSKRVNGGTIGLADRIKHFKEYYNLLT